MIAGEAAVWKELLQIIGECHLGSKEAGGPYASLTDPIQLQQDLPLVIKTTEENREENLLTIVSQMIPEVTEPSDITASWMEVSHVTWKDAEILPYYQVILIKSDGYKEKTDLNLKQPRASGSVQSSALHADTEEDAYSSVLPPPTKGTSSYHQDPQRQIVTPRSSDCIPRNALILPL